MPESDELSRADCERLLRAGVIGRLGVSTPGGPHVIPVNYSVVDDAVVVRTTPYGLLALHARDAWMAFEIDQFDFDYHHGWSVQARGPCEVVEDADVLDRIESTRPPRPWVSGVRPLVLRLPWVELTGRRLGRYGDPVLDLPVHRST